MAGQDVERWTQPGQKHDPLFQATGLGHQWRCGRRRAGGGHAVGHQHWRAFRQDRGWPCPPGRGGWRPRGHHLALAVRHGQGQVLPDDRRAAVRGRGRAHWADFHVRGRRQAAGDRAQSGGQSDQGCALCHPLDQAGHEQLVANGLADFRELTGARDPGLLRARSGRRPQSLRGKTATRVQPRVARLRGTTT